MAISMKFHRFLEKHHVSFQEFPHVPVDHVDEIFDHLDFPRRNLVVGTPLIDSKGPVIAIHSLQSKVDPEKLGRKMNRNFQKLTDTQIRRVMSDCDANSCPPFGNAYGFSIVVDREVTELYDVFFRAGKNDSIIHVNQENLGKLIQGATVYQFGVPLDDEGMPQERGLDGSLISDLKGASLDQVAARLQKVYNLPPMPAIALKILQLTNNPNSEVSDLALTIEQDPPLAAQIMRYARSALFNFPGEINSVQDAVNIVLGYDRVANIAMGIAALKAFSLPNGGPWGLSAIWRHSLYSSYLCQQLALQMPASAGVVPGVAYLSGLLHNIGVLLIGHVFRPEFDEISNLIKGHPETPVSLLERQVFGAGWDEGVLMLGHGTIGAVLLKMWNLPDPVIKACAMHQNKVYDGQDEKYVKLVRVTNYLLHEIGIGEFEGPVDVDALFSSLGFKPDQGRQIVEQALEYRDELDLLASCMVA